jgi:RNA polymerase sigma-70 factor (ECF subfamily)
MGQTENAGEKMNASTNEARNLRDGNPPGLSPSGGGFAPFQNQPLTAIDNKNGEVPSEAGGDEWFRTTHWSVVLAAGDQESARGHEALSRLCHTYWLPVYAFVRKRGYSPEQAKDLTQDFFATFLERNSVARAVRERGRFRSFLLTSAQNFLHDAHDQSVAQKRGGGQRLVSLDELDAEAYYLAEPADDLDPAKAFELRWALTVLDRTMQRLREEYQELGRGDLFETLQAHLWGDAESIPYPTLAERFQISVANVKSIAYRLRQSYRTMLRQEIAHTVSRPDEIDDEILHLMRVVSQ